MKNKVTIKYRTERNKSGYVDLKKLAEDVDNQDQLVEVTGYIAHENAHRICLCMGFYDGQAINPHVISKVQIVNQEPFATGLDNFKPEENN